MSTSDDLFARAKRVSPGGVHSPVRAFKGVGGTPRFMTGGNSVVSAHLKLADDVVLAGRSTVTSDVPVSGHYGGYPLQPLKDFMRTLAALGQLTEIRRNLNRVLKHLQLPERP